MSETGVEEIKKDSKNSKRAELLTRVPDKTARSDKSSPQQENKKSCFTWVALVFYKLNLVVNIKFMFVISMLFSLELLKGAFANIPFMKTNSVYGTLSILIAVAIIGFYGFLIFYTGKKVARIVDIREKLKIWAKTQEDYQSGSETEPLRSDSDKNLGKIQIYQTKRHEEQSQEEEKSQQKIKPDQTISKGAQEIKNIVADEFSNEI